MAEKHNTAFLAIALLVAVGTAALTGTFWGGVTMALPFATGIASLGALLFAAYAGFVRLLRNHFKHLIEASILTVMNPGLGSTKSPEEAEKAMKEVKKDFEKACEIVS